MNSEVDPALLFEIKNLSCSYTLDPGNQVLVVERLSIPRNKITFLLGPSGSGKSTLLETLGLMNNTLAEGSISFFPERNLPPIKFENIWKTPEKNQLNAVRKKYYSFIFQENNLLENFTAYENVCFSRMVKDESDLVISSNSAKELMIKVKLPESEVNADTVASQLSGGQRQRLSFVRALNTRSLVIFCDEPTGNLDEVNASELMNIIRQACDEGSTAIIVSHDINLALKYGDQISVITKEAGRQEGVINSWNTFHKSEWENGENENQHIWKEKIRKLYSNTESPYSSPTKPTASKEKAQTFSRLFVKNELKTLLGKRKVNYWILFFLTIFTFLVLGFANGSLHYLASKQNDVFVNWLTVKIPYQKNGTEFSDIKYKLNKEENKTHYHYSTVTSYPEYTLNFVDVDNSNISYTEEGRTIEVGENPDPIINDILSAKNLVRGGNFLGEDDLGIIVTKQLLDQYHYSNDAAFVNIGYPMVDDSNNFHYEKVPIKIRAVVKSIPGKNLFLTTTRFYSAWLQTDSTNTFDIRSHKKKLCYFLKGPSSVSEGWQKKVNSLCSENPILSSWSPEIHDVDSDISMLPGRVIEIILTPEPPDTATVNSLSSLLISQLPIEKSLQITRFYDLENYESQPLEESSYGHDIMCINFSGNMDSIRQFKNFLYSLNATKQNGAIEIDESSVREKENFNYMSKVTWIISIGLLFFSIFSIAVFISNILRLHLLKMKQNIGTLKAFGLSDALTSNLYMRVMLLFISIVIFPAFILAVLIGKLIDISLHHTMVVDSEFSYFMMLDAKTIVVVFSIIFLSLLVAGVVAIKILLKSPGDLIYNR